LWRIGIDTGGTFTDLVAVRGGEIRTAKVPSTPPAFDDGVLDSLGAAGIPARDVLLLAHGTTATTNAVITKTGARTGPLTTRGFRDVLELRRHNRGEIYDILWDPPEPLVPRRLGLRFPSTSTTRATSSFRWRRTRCLPRSNVCARRGCRLSRSASSIRTRTQRMSCA
jgi:N-methylhydantoinase A/oxoprolinase/acetone carboxylase beta subunit